MNRRPLVALVIALAAAAIAWSGIGIASPGQSTTGRERLRAEGSLPAGFVPAVLRQQQPGRYFVVMDGPSVAERIAGAGDLSAGAQKRAAKEALASQAGAIAQVSASGGDVVFRYKTLVNGFSANLSPAAAAALASRTDVSDVEPVSIVRKLNGTSAPFIGAPLVWRRVNAQGEGMRVALVDTGIDYTHKNFGGPGTVAAYERNNPNFVEQGTFPTAKVIGGYDFVGPDYDVLDDETSNDTPRPDPDPLDQDGHGSHTGGTCCGIGVRGRVGKGVAPKAKLLAFKVWDVGNSTDDVLVAAYERAVDPNLDGNIRDAADVLSFSGGVDYGTQNSTEAVAAKRVVRLGTVFVAAAGNSNNQPAGGSAYITGTPASVPGVISVAASIDQFNAQTIKINSPQIELPDDGLMVQQEWGADLPAGGLTDNLFDGRAVDAPPQPGNESPADAMFCAPLPGGSLAARTVLVFKGATGGGDCAGSTKAFNAQNAGARAVIMVSLFGGLPSALGTNGEPVTIPTVMISGADGYAILDALSPAPPAYNTGTVNATLEDELTLIPGFDDAMTDFTSEGPARLTSLLKPDISAPGFDIKSADVGTGNRGVKFSGTSMAAPHVAGVATLLRQIHPGWSPGTIKAALMNQATPEMKNNDLSEPVPATVMGAGRVRAFRSARAVSVARPGSLSFGLRQTAGPLSLVRHFRVHNYDRRAHSYQVAGDVRYTDFDPALTSVSVSTDKQSFGGSRSFTLEPGESQAVFARLTLHPSAFTEADQLNGWFYFNGNADGAISVRQSLGRRSTLKVPWHVVPLAASRSGLSKSTLNLANGPDTMTLRGGGAGIDFADLYLLGATDAVDDFGEGDIVATGARSFTGGAIGDGQTQGVPAGTDEVAGLRWLEFLSGADEPVEPVEFAVQAADVHNTTETLEVDVLVDAGADGQYAGSDEGIDADYLVVKEPVAGGTVCVFDLSQANALDECAASYFPDYSNYNSNLVGLVVDARAIGLSNERPLASYQVTACTGTFSGDVPAAFCDTAGGTDEQGRYTSRLNATRPALAINHLVCRGFWDGGACDGADPIQVSVGSAGPGEAPSILALFPNSKPSRDPTIVSTQR
jgi:subtilisin family serine protease